MNLATSPRQMALDVYAQWDADYARKVEARKRETAARIFANPVELALVVAEAINEAPVIFGQALQALQDGDPMFFALKATEAVFQKAGEV